MSTGTQVCDIVLPGYTLVDRIGMGGYAEVWRAEAPGGIQKAVKVVYGYYDDEFATQELKSLERIKGVRHPFLLSLERFEIINGRLAILTELADMSLDQRRRQCCAEGLPGIPRDELMRYMADAAEALDFLEQRHQLLHLDIKPENLLILGDHIKVADFGLVKELASRTQNSLVSGMTPTYASPEMFDDNPSAYSDQYSLAIVYQEMLAGTLPFPGRTAAQLAKQHTQAEPQLQSLPAADRPVIARALAKKPEDRFPSCRAFVEALLHRSTGASPQGPVEIPRPPYASPVPATVAPDDTRSPSFHTTLRREMEQSTDSVDVMATQPMEAGARLASAAPAAAASEAPVSFVPEETIDVAVPAADPRLRREQPTLYIAIGGAGIQVLCRFRTLTAPHHSEDYSNDAMGVIALDTDRNELRDACSSRWKPPLAAEDTLHLPLRLPKSYDNARDILGWVSRRWLYNIPRSLETRGYRPLGRVALVDHTPRVIGLLEQKLGRLATAAAATDAAGEPREQTVRIVLLAGMGGGTGGGMIIDVANAVRSVAASRNIPVEVQAFLVCSWLGSNNSSPLVAANSYSLLTELNHATARGNVGSTDGGKQSTAFESCNLPIDSLYLVPTRGKSADGQASDGLDTVARYLALETTPDARSIIRSCRASQTPREQLPARSLAIKTLGVASLANERHKFTIQLAAELAQAIKRHWVTVDRSANWEQLCRDEKQAASAANLEADSSDKPTVPVAAAPANETTPLALRRRFNQYMSLEFASEVLRQVERRLEARDERGQPVMLPRDAKLIADTARTVAAALAARVEREPPVASRFADSPLLRPLIAAGSERVIGRSVEKFDIKQSEKFLPADAIDEILQCACQALLEEKLRQPDIAKALTADVDLDSAIARTIERADVDLLQCGCDRRTLLFVPAAEAHSATAEKMRAARPLAAVMPADIDDALVVTEATGISPRSLALGFERVFPGIADAARRLLTRIDIEWQSVSSN
jgi:hypothetical protein